jgi:hypothetical protein
MDSGPDTPGGVGFPIRTPADQRSLASPRGFSQRATSFVASWRQGIHRTPFIRSGPADDTIITRHHARTQGQTAPHPPTRASPIASQARTRASLLHHASNITRHFKYNPTIPSSPVKEQADHPGAPLTRSTSRRMTGVLEAPPGNALAPAIQA